MAKGDNLGAGLPEGLLNTITGMLIGGGAKGTPAEQAGVFLEIAREEHAALHPGGGTTSMVDAMLKYNAIAQAVDELSAAAIPPAQTAAIAKLGEAIKLLGKQWADFGPVGDEFLNSAKKP